MKHLLPLFILINGCKSVTPDMDVTLAERSTVMWHETPAQSWVDGYPIGNGIIGGMVLGQPHQERIALNHSRLWRGKRWQGKSNPKTAHNLPYVRKLFFDGDLIGGSNAAKKMLGSQKDVQVDPYQPVGDLFILHQEDTTYSSYKRELDLSTGIVKISYTTNGINYTREIFTAKNENIIAVRIKSSRPKSLNGLIQLSRIEDTDCSLKHWAIGSTIGMSGEFIEGVRFAVNSVIIPKGGKLDVNDPDDSSISLKEVDEITIFTTISTGKETNSPGEYNDSLLNEFQKKYSFDQLSELHIKEYQSLFNRVSLVFDNDTSKINLPIDERLNRIAAGERDEAIYPLYYQFGRYLLISGSVKGGVPLNLQGMWNESLTPPWGADYHQDCNIQMNYWLAENGNLEECAYPLFEYIHGMLPYGREAALNMYGCRGIWFPLESTPLGKCLKPDHGWSEWTGVAAWLSQHLWWHWEYTGDIKFLKEKVYPLYKEVGMFYEDYLVKDERKSSNYFGKLVTVPSQSPENYFVGGTKPVSLCIGSTIDFQLIHEVFSNLLTASEILQTDSTCREKWRYILNNIPSLQIGKYGQLQEWLEDYEEAEPNHRHISHLYGVFPGNQITMEDIDKRFIKAARVSIDRRLANFNDISPWPAARAWYGLVYSRMYEGDSALQLLHSNFSDKSLIRPNMLSTLKGNVFQIDGNFAGAALIGEMLMQSQNNIIRILPALPSSWPQGKLSGLIARDGFEISIEWKNGKLRSATITSKNGNPCDIRYNGHQLQFPTVSGKKYNIVYSENGISLKK